MKAVVVLSGGQDSTLALTLAIKKYGAKEVSTITFDYGQRHAVEVKYAKRIAQHFGVKNKCVKLDFYSKLTDNALFNPKAKITKKKGAKCPTTVVEGRNAFFLLAAAVWAKTLGARAIYTGVSEADFSGYPDCREQFVRAMEKSIVLALDYQVKIVTPFMHKTKKDEWVLAKRLGIMDFIKTKTVTCYNGIPGAGCGKCPACKLRARGLQDAGDNLVARDD